MAEEGNGTGTGGAFDTEGKGGEDTKASWYDGMEGITTNPEVLAFAKKYESAEAAAKGGQEAEKKIGSSFRLPDDLKGLTIEQQADLMGKVSTLRDIPETVDGYEITVPEGLERNEAVESAFRAFAFEHKWGKKDVTELMSFYHNALLTAQNVQVEANEKETTEAETTFRIRCGKDFDKTMDNIKRVRMMVSRELGLNYDDNGVIKSKLDDCLNKTRLGNAIEVNMLLSWIHEKFLQEGVPIPGGPGVEGGGADFFKYDKVDK